MQSIRLLDQQRGGILLDVADEMANEPRAGRGIGIGRRLIRPVGQWRHPHQHQTAAHQRPADGTESIGRKALMGIQDYQLALLAKQLRGALQAQLFWLVGIFAEPQALPGGCLRPEVVGQGPAPGRTAGGDDQRPLIGGQGPLLQRRDGGKRYLGGRVGGQGYGLVEIAEWLDPTRLWGRLRPGDRSGSHSGPIGLEI